MSQKKEMILNEAFKSYFAQLALNHPCQSLMNRDVYVMIIDLQWLYMSCFAPIIYFLLGLLLASRYS